MVSVHDILAQVRLDHQDVTLSNQSRSIKIRIERFFHLYYNQRIYKQDVMSEVKAVEYLTETIFDLDLEYTE